MTKEQFPLITGGDYTQRGEQIVAFYADGWERLGEWFPPVYDNAITDLLLTKHTELIGKAQVDTLCYNGMRDTLAFERANMDTDKKRVEREKDPYNPIKQAIHDQVVEKQHMWEQQIENKKNNFARYDRSCHNTVDLIEDLIALFMDGDPTYPDLPLRDEEKEAREDALNVVESLVEMLRDLEQASLD